jgi:hypothetical protein
MTSAYDRSVPVHGFRVEMELLLSERSAGERAAALRLWLFDFGRIKLVRADPFLICIGTCSSRKWLGL